MPFELVRPISLAGRITVIATMLWAASLLILMSIPNRDDFEGGSYDVLVGAALLVCHVTSWPLAAGFIPAWSDDRSIYFPLMLPNLFILGYGLAAVVWFCRILLQAYRRAPKNPA